MMPRTIICHYHIFKTAGTSFERVLRNNFGQRHLSFDGPKTSSMITQTELSKVINTHPHLASISSHQITLPAPVSDQFLALPVVFVRHPILRIRSVFLHENRNASERLESPMEGFEAWVEELVAGHPNQLQICNLQTNLLCREANSSPKGVNANGRPLYDLEAALSNLSEVSCIGRAECFDEDVASFIPTLAAAGIRLNYLSRITENVGAPDFGSSVEQQLDNMRAQLSGATWDKLFWFNEQDIALYDTVCRRLEAGDQKS
jgi:hypothetical protein